MFEEINNYSQWNKALWAYFCSNENPIIYLDGHLIKEIGEESLIKAIDYEVDFLSKSLLNKQKVSNFVRDWKSRTGNSISIVQGSPYRKDINKWTFEDLCYFLVTKRLDGIPAYFGMLCAIMYLACTEDANHAKIKNRAKKYLESNYSDHVGELIDDLFRHLHRDFCSFDPDRMICGQQRNMSRIKFHTVLRASEREDFIDFLEINNLKWDYEQYPDFINDRVIPMLNRAGKRQFINLVTKEEYIPYVKSILQSGLTFGKTKSVTKNIKQPIDIVWKYELYFDFNGEPSFYISANTSLPFGLSIENHNFIVDDSNRFSDYIAADTDFQVFESREIKWGGDTYILKNVGNSEWKEIFFKKVSDGIYHQVFDLQDGNDYIKFIRKGARNVDKLSKGWSQSNKVFSRKILDSYYIYEVSDYKCDKPKVAKRSSKVNDSFCLHGVGTWFSIILQGNQKLFWHPDKLDSGFIPVKYIVGEDNKCYFRLPRTSESQISGKLIVTSADPKTEKYDTNELIIDNFEWVGDSAKYYINGWGEISDRDCLKVGNARPKRQQILQVRNEQMHQGDCYSTPTSLTNMLIQILYDVADKNGCVNQTELVAAIDFVLGAFNLTPTKQNRRSIIYALRRLGYMSSFYNPSTKAYVNQLTPSYLELSNYSIYGRGNAYVVKGVYSCEKLAMLIENADRIGDLRVVCYKRPYDEATLMFNPEYKVLPDLILIVTRKLNNWRCFSQPIAESLIDMMSDISDFEDHFGTKRGGDSYPCPTRQETPCMIKNRIGAEILCTGTFGSYRIHETYCNDKGEMLFIPKHLSRAFCQKKKNAPSCIMEKDVQGSINLGNITFASGMAKPQILDMALCDLSLGLPEFEYLFIVNQQEVIKNKYAFIEGRSYSTHATAADNQYLKKAIEKLSGQSITDYVNTPAIFVSRNRRHANGYQMKMWSDSDNCKALVLIDKTNDVIAFSWKKKTYVKTSTNEFYEVASSKTANEILSDIITHKQLSYGEKLNHFDLSRFDDENLKTVRIIIK